MSVARFLTHIDPKPTTQGSEFTASPSNRPAASQAARTPAKQPAPPPPRKKLLTLSFNTLANVLNYAALVRNFEAQQNPQTNPCLAPSTAVDLNFDAITPPPDDEDEAINAAADYLLLSADPSAFTPPPPPPKAISKRKPKTRAEMDTYNERRRNLRHWKRLGILEAVLDGEKSGIPGPPQHIVPAHASAEPPRAAVQPAEPASGCHVVPAEPATAPAAPKPKRVKTEETRRKEAKAARDKRLLLKLNVWSSHESLTRLCVSDPVEAAARREHMAAVVRAADEAKAAVERKEAAIRAELTAAQVQEAEQDTRKGLGVKVKAPAGLKPRGARKSYQLDPKRIIKGGNLKDLCEA